MCLLKGQRRFLITEQHSLVIGTLDCDAEKLAPSPIQADSFDSENLILLLFPIITLCLLPPLGQLELNNFWVEFVCFVGLVLGFFSEPYQGSQGSFSISPVP